MNGFIFKGTYDILERLILSNIRRKLQLLDKIINTGWRRINQMPINIIMGKRNAKFSADCLSDEDICIQRMIHLYNT